MASESSFQGLMTRWVKKFLLNSVLGLLCFKLLTPLACLVPVAPCLESSAISEKSRSLSALSFCVRIRYVTIMSPRARLCARVGRLSSWSFSSYVSLDFPEGGCRTCGSSLLSSHFGALSGPGSGQDRAGYCSRGV